MSLLANTEQRPAMRAAQLAPHTTSPDFLHRVLHAQRLLVEERAGAGGAFAGAVVIDDVAAVQADVLGAFAADFEDRADLRIERADHAGDGFEFVLEEEAQHLGDGAAAGAGDADAFDAVFGDHVRRTRAADRRWIGWGCRRCGGNRRAPAAAAGGPGEAEPGCVAHRASRTPRSSGAPRAASLRLIAPISRPILMPISK